MTKKKQELYYAFEEVIPVATDEEILKILNRFDKEDFLYYPIVFDLVSYNKVDILKELHEKNIPLNYCDNGSNALHVACGATGSLDCVKFFIENDIFTDINQASHNYGDTPLTLAISYNNKKIVKYLTEKFKVNSVSLKDLEVILDRVKSNYKRTF